MKKEFRKKKKKGYGPTQIVECSTSVGLTCPESICVPSSLVYSREFSLSVSSDTKLGIKLDADMHRLIQK